MGRIIAPGVKVFRIVFKAIVTVAGKITIDSHCSAKIAIAREGGASAMAVDESKGGVAVIGALRVTRFDCEAKESVAKKLNK